MDIHDAARYFENDAVTDGYTGAFLFNGQTSSFNDSHSDGATNRRRLLSTDPGAVMPARRVINIYGIKYVVGTGTPDGFYGSPIRQIFSMKKATDFSALLTPGEAVSGAAGTNAWVHKNYLKDTPDTLTTSAIDTFWNIFVAPGETAVRGTFLREPDGTLYRVRNTYLPVEGLRVLQSDALPLGARTTATFATGTYQPVTDTYTAGTSVVNAIKVETPKFYRFRDSSDPLDKAGDFAVFVPSSLTVKPGQSFTMGGTKWLVQTVQTELDAQVIHARPA